MTKPSRKLLAKGLCHLATFSELSFLLANGKDASGKDANEEVAVIAPYPALMDVGLEPRLLQLERTVILQIAAWKRVLWS